MNTKQKDNWRKIRQKGQLRFILGGMFLFGLGGLVFSSLIDYGFEFFLNDTPNYMHESDRFVFKILLRLVIFSIAGILINYSVWNKNEAEFFQNGQEK